MMRDNLKHIMAVFKNIIEHHNQTYYLARPKQTYNPLTLQCFYNFETFQKFKDLLKKQQIEISFGNIGRRGNFVCLGGEYLM